ncbi:MAG: hypothetical protein RLZZ591_2179, partial [Pseudomonadota bacterium]
MNDRSNDASTNMTIDSSQLLVGTQGPMVGNVSDASASDGAVAQLLQSLLASAEQGDRVLVAALSDGGFANLDKSQLTELAQRLAALEEKSAAQVFRQKALADQGEDGLGFRTQENFAAEPVWIAQAPVEPNLSAPGLKAPAEGQTSNPPAPQTIPSTARIALELFRALSEGQVPSVTSLTIVANGAQAPTGGSEGVNPNTRLAAEILRALNDGLFPDVSGATSTVSGLGQNAPVPGFPAAALISSTSPSSPSIDAQVFAQATAIVQQATSLLPGGGNSVSASLNNTSGVQMGQVQGLTSLGSGVDVANAALITPFVLQVVNPDGSLTTQAVPLGQTIDPVYTGAVNPALSLGGGRAQVDTTEAVLPAEAPKPQAPLPPDPSGQVSVSCLTPTVIEGTGEDGITEIVFLLTRTNPMSVESIAWSVSGLEAYDLVDGALGFSGSVQFSGGQLTQEVRLRVKRDHISEPDRPLTITIQDGLYSTVDVGSASSELVDDDRPTLSVDNVRVEEKAGYAVFTVSLSRPSVDDMLFKPGLGVGTARPGADAGTGAELEYSVDGGTTWLSATAGARIPAYSTSILVRTAIKPDDVYEGPESLNLLTGPVVNAATSRPALLNNPEGATGTLTIEDNGTFGSGPDDDRPTLTVAGVDDVSEGSPAVFAVRLSNALERPTSIDLGLTDLETESGDVDPPLEAFYYADPVNRTGRTVLTVVNGRVELPVGVTEIFVRVDTKSDNVFEGAERFALTAGFVDPALKYADRTGTDPTLRTGASGTDTSTVVDDGSGAVYDREGKHVIDSPDTPGNESTPDDDRPTLTVAGVTVEEGSSAVFTVTLNTALENATNIALSLDDVGLSAESADYASYIVYTNPADIAGSTLVVSAGVFSLPGGATTFYVKAATTTDNVYEGAEDFRLTASFDEAALKFADRTGTSSTVRTGATANATSTIYDDGSQSDGDDDTDGTSDGTDTAGTSDDDRPTLSVSGGRRVSEGSTALFDVTVSGTREQPIEIALTPGHVSTEDGDWSTTVTAFYYTDEANRTGRVELTVTSGSIQLPASVDTFHVRVQTTQDSAYEGEETVQLTAAFAVPRLRYEDASLATPVERSGASGSATAVILDDGSGTVYDPEGNPAVNDPNTTTVDESAPDDDRPVFSFTAPSVTVVEGQPMPFVVSRTSSSGAETLSYELIVTSSDATTLPTVYQGTVSFADGDTQATINLSSVDDQRITPDQTFSLVLSTSNRNIRVGEGTAQGVVRNNDAEISIESMVAIGPDANGFYTYTVTVQRTGALGFTHKVDWGVAGLGENPASTRGFQLPTSQLVTFGPNASTSATSDTQQFTFRAPAGLIVDGERTFQVNLTATSETAAMVALGRDAARGVVTPAGAAASIEAVS